jgi:hypothetical protein
LTSQHHVTFQRELRPSQLDQHFFCSYRDAVHRNELLQLLPQLNPSITTQHFNTLMDEMFAEFEVGGATGVMTCNQVSCTGSLCFSEAFMRAGSAFKLSSCCSCPPKRSFRGISSKYSTRLHFTQPQLLMLLQAFIKLQAELTREGMSIELGSEDPDLKNR